MPQALEKGHPFFLGPARHGLAVSVHLRAEFRDRLLAFLGLILQIIHRAGAHPAQSDDLSAQTCHIIRQHVLTPVLGWYWGRFPRRRGLLAKPLTGGLETVRAYFYAGCAALAVRPIASAYFR